MKFTLIEDKVQLGHRGYVRHKVADMVEGDLVQKCVLCGEIIEDHEKYFLSICFDSNGKKTDYVPKGMPAGYVFVSVEKNPSSKFHEMIQQLGMRLPDDYIDCTVANS